MDTFMDKLTQKLTAQEMIKANSAADAAELSHLKEQTAAYEALIEKMNAVNSKHEEDLNRLIQEAMAKIDEVQAIENNQSDNSEVLNELKSNLGQQFEQLTDHVHKENVKVYRNVQAAIIEETAKQNEVSGKTLHSISGKSGAILGISIVSLIVSIAGIIFQLLVYLHII